MAMEGYTGMFGGSAANGGYQDAGVGNNEASYREVTRKGKYPSDNTGPSRSQGETPGAGTLHAATLNERPNMAQTRNLGPTRPCSRSAATPIPIMTMASRATGRASS